MVRAGGSAIGNGAGWANGKKSKARIFLQGDWRGKH
jgi:hypothetical protein